jgi:hypothetical protein
VFVAQTQQKEVFGGFEREQGLVTPYARTPSTHPRRRGPNGEIGRSERWAGKATIYGFSTEAAQPTFMAVTHRRTEQNIYSLFRVSAGSTGELFATHIASAR